MITGAAGFIGSHLTEALLSTGSYVLGIDNFDPFYDRDIKLANVAHIRAMMNHASNADRFELIEQNICDADSMQRIAAEFQPQMIVHLAALAGVRSSIEEPARFANVNIDGTVALLDAARNCNCRLFLFASSSSVYGNNEKVPFSEDDPIDAPISPYAATKRAAELLCGTYAHLFDMRIASLRFFTVFGPRQRPDLAIARFMQMVQRGQPIVMFGDGTTSRDYTYIDDVVRGIGAAATKLSEMPTGTHRIWNLGGSSPVALSELIEAIAEVTGSEPTIDRQPMQPGDVERTWADLSRSEQELGYQPSTALLDGLHTQWSWLQSQVSRPLSPTT